MATNFTKMQGLGNKFVVFEGPFVVSGQEVVNYCREYGDTGADGLLIVTPLGPQTLAMKYWNKDGSKAEMCGNGLRCVTRFAVDGKMVKPGKFVIKTDAGPLQVIWDGKDSDKIEVQIGGVYIDEAPVTLYGFTFHKVNVGNPHAVTFVDNVELAPIKEVGPKVEINDHFPNRTNVEFVQIINSSTIQVRTWERGSGETLACGTAMVAAAAVAVKFKGAHYPIAVNVLGGSARVWLDDEKYMRMVGPASYS